jgi:hypothetical protein
MVGVLVRGTARRDLAEGAPAVGGWLGKWQGKYPKLNPVLTPA